MVVAAILKKSMKDDKLLQKHVTYYQKDIAKAKYSPITEKYLAKGMSVADLCVATLQYSDNTAANLLMKDLGGQRLLQRLLVP
jgi:beta-lactamase class A